MASAPDFSARRAALDPQARAFTDHTTARQWTFAEVDAEAERVAQWMRPLGRGARVGVLAYNRAETFIALFAARKAGVILCPLNWRSPLPELQAVAEAVGLGAMIHDAAHAPLAVAVRADLPVLPMSDSGGYDLPPLSAPVAAFDLDEDAPWYLLMTSGTTGLPKAVIQTGRMAQAVAVNLAQAVGLLGSDSGLCYLPLFHTAGINLFTLPLFQWGGHSHILPRADMEAITALLEAGEVTQFFGVPVIWQGLADHPRRAALGLGRLRGLASGGANLPEALVAGFAAEGAMLRNGFGLTESGPTGFLMDDREVLARQGSVGKPQMMTEARLRDVPDGQAGEGELMLRGATITPGYYANPAATEAAFEDGWLRTGDVARRDAEGFYWIIDRLKDMYVSGGENVWPAEVERILITHPSVLEAAVIGRPDPKWGEVGRAYLRLREGASATPAEVLDWCRGRLAGFKLPKEVRIVEDFPRTASGKIRKVMLARDEC